VVVGGGEQVRCEARVGLAQSEGHLANVRGGLRSTRGRVRERTAAADGGANGRQQLANRSPKLAQRIANTERLYRWLVLRQQGGA
jgi:hypothetical protein